MSNENDAVLLQVDGGIASIRFNRPAVLNAIDPGLAEQFRDTCRFISTSRSIRVVVLSGKGKAFMAGGDLALFHDKPESAPEIARAMIDPLHEALALMTAFPIPVIASIHGAVAGAGVSLMLACDLAIAADNVRLSMAYSRIGASLDGSGSWFLPRVLGIRKAMELALMSEMLDAQEAYRLGLINRVVPEDDLAAETEALALRLAAGPTFAYGKIKGLLQRSFDRNLEEQMQLERDAFCACAGTKDFAEALDAFFCRRSPQFEGC